MDPRFKPIAIEIIVAIGLFIVLFQGKILPSDLSNPFILFIVALFVAEFIRILVVLRQLRRSGVDIDNEGIKSPLLYGLNTNLGNAGFQFNKIGQPVRWVIGIIFSFIALTVVIFIISAIIGR